jgi:hypothetical protein
MEMTGHLHIPAVLTPVLIREKAAEGPDLVWSLLRRKILFPLPEIRPRLGRTWRQNIKKNTEY